MKSNTKIEKQLKRKTNNIIVETVVAAKKNKAWFKIAEMLSGPRRKMINLNLEEINKRSKETKIIVVPGKVLSQGKLDKKIKIVALSFSENAKKKILSSKGETSNILEEIKKNPEAKGVEILK
ncbi:50S ribosomal protein L18e [Nanoarchaeota archaeon]